MPAFIYAIIGALIQAAGSIAGRAMIALGIGMVTMTGFQASLDFATDFIASRWSTLPVQAYQLLAVLRVGADIGIIVGAVIAKMTLKGLTSDSLTFWVMRGKL